MKETAMKVVTKMDELMADITKMILSEDILDEMEPEQITLMMRSLSLINDSKQLMIKEAEMLDTINAKLDKLLSKGE